MDLTAGLDVAPPLGGRRGVDITRATVRGRRLPVLLAFVAGAWLVVLISQATGNAAASRHHA